MSKEPIDECFEGNHKLEEIYRSGYEDDIQNVARWCSVCGSVVVDIDYDNRTKAGGHMKLCSPEISRRTIG